MCPKGDDPFTSSTDYRTIRLTTSATAGTLSSGQFKFTFNGESFYFSAAYASFDSAACETAFESLPNIGDVICSRSAINARGGATYTIEFLSFPVMPHENNLYTNDGNPPLSSFQCDPSKVTGVTTPTCVIATVSTGDLPG
jgi:hypothetical protein